MRTGLVISPWSEVMLETEFLSKYDSFLYKEIIIDSVFAICLIVAAGITVKFKFLLYVGQGLFHTHESQSF